MNHHPGIMLQPTAVVVFFFYFLILVGTFSDDTITTGISFRSDDPCQFNKQTSLKSLAMEFKISADAAKMMFKISRLP